MPAFFGNPVLPTYTGITAQDALTDEEKAQQQGFDQQRQHMMDVQQGRDSGDDNPSTIGTAIGRIRSLFGSSNDPNQAGTSAWADRMNAVGDSAAGSAAPALDAASAGAPSAAVSGTDTIPSSGLMRLRNAPMNGQPSSSDGVSQGVNGAPTPDLWGMNRQDATDATGMLTPAPAAGAGTPAPKMGAGAGGAPMAGEFVPQMGRFATAQDGQQYTQLAQAAAAGIPPQGLMATRGGQGAQIGPWASGYGPRGPGGAPLASQPTGNVTRTPATAAAPIQPQAGAGTPSAATRAPAPAPTMPAGSAPASAAPQLVNAQAAIANGATAPASASPQLVNAQAQAAGTIPSMRDALPSVPDFLAEQGVAPTVSRPGLGTVSRVVPLLQPELEANVLSSRLDYMNNARLGQIAEQGRQRLMGYDERAADAYGNFMNELGPRESQWLDQQGTRYGDQMAAATQREGWKTTDLQAATQSHIAAARAIKTFGGDTPRGRQATVQAALTNFITEAGADPDKAASFYDTSPDRKTLESYGLTEDGVRGAATTFQQKGDMAAALNLVGHFAASDSTAGAKVQATRAGVRAASGNASEAPSAATLPTLSPKQIAGAKQDAGYASYLKGLGYSTKLWQ